MNKTITLTVAGTDFSFTVGAAEYNGYINEIMPDNKVAPSHNLLIRAIAPEQKAPLKQLLDEHPGAAMHMAGLLMQEYAPTLEVSVKK